MYTGYAAVDATPQRSIGGYYAVITPPPHPFLPRYSTGTRTPGTVIRPDARELRDALEEVTRGLARTLEATGGAAAVPVVRSDYKRGKQFGTGSITNASHVLDWDYVKQVCPTVETQAELKGLTSLLNASENLPVKSRAANFGTTDPTSDISLDKEIIAAVKAGGGTVSDLAFARAQAKLGLLKGKGKDAGLSDATLGKLIKPFEGIRNVKGAPVTDPYTVVYRDGKPYNAWQGVPAKLTGMKTDGTPDLRTSKGKAVGEKGKSFAQETGLRKDGTAHEGTKLGKQLGAPVRDTCAAETGLKLDGKPDLRTKLGKLIAEAQDAKLKTGLLKSALPTTAGMPAATSGGAPTAAVPRASGGAPRAHASVARRSAAEVHRAHEVEPRAREIEVQRAREAEAQRAREAEARAREADVQRAREAEAQRAREAEARAREAEAQRAREIEAQRAREYQVELMRQQMVREAQAQQMLQYQQVMMVREPPAFTYSSGHTPSATGPLPRGGYRLDGQPDRRCKMWR